MMGPTQTTYLRESINLTTTRFHPSEIYEIDCKNIRQCMRLVEITPSLLYYLPIIVLLLFPVLKVQVPTRNKIDSFP